MFRWRVTNQTNFSWPPSVCLLALSENEDDDNLIQLQRSSDISAIGFNEEQTITAYARAPRSDGHHVAFYRLADAETLQKFGQRLRMRIVIGDDVDEDDEESVDEEDGDAPSMSELLARLRLLGFSDHVLCKRILMENEMNMQKTIYTLMQRK